MTGPIESPVPPGWTRQELAELNDRELLGIVSSLPRFSQRRMAACELLVGRFYDSMTQDQIGRQLGICQMQVSQLLSHALGYLRPRLLGLDEATAR